MIRFLIFEYFRRAAVIGTLYEVLFLNSGVRKCCANLDCDKVAPDLKNRLS